MNIRLSRVIASALALSLVVSAPGSRAWGQVAAAVRPGSVGAAMSGAAVTLTPAAGALSAPALTLSVPSLSAPAPAASASGTAAPSAPSGPDRAEAASCRA